ncbi:hypothetical protein EVJ58_g9451 [Rhodofomes roseus]|uniref:Uncharacterized protein n=1 Tax=Rhodofomes roseus TaxID=34475 RepID=A0A4Y9XTR8_9APHY|nr:hypothetical protein EVJ58_g9451 [Rhodofomes roseus]
MDQGDQADKRGDPTPDWGVRLPSVTALDLKAERPDLSLSYTDSLLFCFPNISDLTIDSYSYILRKPHRDMTAPLLRLRKLVINDPSFNKQLPSILHSAVSLEHLELSTVLAKRDKWDFADRDRVDSWRMSEIFDLSRNPCLSSLHLRFTYDERDQWGDPWAHALRQVSAFHASLNHVMLHIGPSLGLVANLGLYERHQGLLVRELERVLSDLPQLVLVFRVNGFREPFKSVRRTFASALASPNPVAHSERLRIQFSEWTSGDQPVALESAESLPLLDA